MTNCKRRALATSLGLANGRWGIVERAVAADKTIACEAGKSSAKDTISGFSGAAAAIRLAACSDSGVATVASEEHCGQILLYAGNSRPQAPQ